MDVFTKNASKYQAMFKRGASVQQVAAAAVEDEVAEFKSAECAPDPVDRDMVRLVVEYGAKELGVTAPRVRFFKSAGLASRGAVDRRHPDEIWVAADKPWYEMGEVALHELAHTAHLHLGLSPEGREADARRFAERRRHWVRSAARMVAGNG